MLISKSLNTFLGFGFMILFDINLPVDISFNIHHFDFFFPVFVNGSEDEVLEIVKSTSFNSNFDIRVLDEDVIVQERSSKCKANGEFQSNINEMTVRLVHDVVITNHLSSSLLLTHYCLLSRNTIREKRKTNSYKTVCNEVHFGNFLIFIVDYFIVIRIFKSSWQKASSDVVLKPHIFQCFSVKKSTIFGKEIMIEILRDKLFSNGERQQLWTVIILSFETFLSIVLTVIDHVFRQSFVQRIWKRLIHSKTS